MSEEERETPTVHSHSEECEQLPEPHAAKGKPIKKQRLEAKGAQNKLSKEERMKIQKEKNREAAQRSRDQHKEYVTNLQLQVKTLKQQIELNKQFCFKCQRELTTQDRYYDNGLENDLSDEENNIFQQEQQQLMQAEPEKLEAVEPPQEEDYFLRVKTEDDDFSYLKMMLFIAMIAIAVFVSSSGSTPTDTSRHLLQVYQSPLSKPISTMDEFSIRANDSGSHQHPAQILVDLNRGLVVRNSVINEQCLDSLHDYQPSFSLTNLRSSHPSLGPQLGQGILLCSFEQQKATGVPQEGQQSSLLKLFLMGAEIKEMVGANSPIKKFIESNLQLNGIYRVNAEIKQVELIPHHNCLL